MPKSSDPKRHWRRLHEWPAEYRQLWQELTTSVDDLDDPRYGTELRPASIATIARGFGRWLNFLDVRGELDPSRPPALLVTANRVADYLREMYGLRYSGQSITLAISALSCAMQIFAPEQNWDWIWKPNGVPLAPYLKSPRKEFPVPHPSKLYQWGLELMSFSPDQARERDRLAQFRDGLMICLLTGRAIRLESFMLMRVDEHLFAHGDRWRLKFEPHEVKNRRWVEVNVPKTLSLWIEKYLIEIRPALLKRTSARRTRDDGHEARESVWVSVDGTKMSQSSLDTMLWNRSYRKFKIKFCSHRFRHSMGTHAPIDIPEHPGIATSLLSIGARMHEKHYNRGKNHIADAKYQKVIEEERKQTGRLARRLLDNRFG
jgi:site-specific recombinase XerD